MTLLALLGCIESGLAPDGDKATSPFDSSPLPDDTGTPPPPEEACNGVDDDGDGAVDEGFPDADGNGRVDCLDLECPTLQVGVAGEVPPLDTCAAMAPVEDPWEVEVAWDYAVVSADRAAFNSYASPVIGQLTDDDGDGDIDADDLPDVLTLLFGWVTPTWLVALDGPTGAELWVSEGWHYASHVAIVDVDGDGVPNVLSFSTPGVLDVLEPDGRPTWSWGSADPTWYEGVHLAVGDLDGDGDAEVLADTDILDGASGAWVASLPIAPTEAALRLPTLADLDLDGQLEIVVHGGVYGADGALRWTAGFGKWEVQWGAPVQADADPEGEVCFVHENELGVWDTDGTPLWTASHASARPGGPCVGDFDGDGAAELAFAGQADLSLWEMDGTRVWSVATTDNSGIASCTGYDLDGDGALEVLYGGEVTFGVYDGRTGATRYEDPTVMSGTLVEAPAVADLDGDGGAEIVVQHNNLGSGPALRVYRHAGAGWHVATDEWPVWDYTTTNVEPGGGVPTAAPPPWSTGVGLRGAAVAGPEDAPDLRVAFTDLCVADCDWGPVEVAAQVENQGTAAADAGGTLTLYADDAGALRPVRTETLPAVPAGARLDGHRWSLTPAEVGTHGFVVEVAPAGGQVECDGANNRDSRGPGCDATRR